MSLRYGGFLGHFEPEKAEQLLGLGRVHCYPNRSTVIFSGDEVRAVSLVCSGPLKVAITTVEGREVVLNTLGPGDIIGDLSIFDDKPALATITTLGPVELSVIPMGTFQAVLDSEPAVTMQLLRTMSARVRDSAAREIELSSSDALGRVCGRLIELMARYGHPEDDRVVITAPLSQADIAGWAGLSREAVVKALATLRHLGWIRTSGRTITVLDSSSVGARAGCGQPNR